MSAKEIIKPLKWLIGKWQSVSAKGKFPTIKSFSYCEEMEFAFVGQPMLNFTSKTWMADTEKIRHLHSGFLRLNPGTNQVSLLLAHNSGMTSVEEGEVSECEMKLESSHIAYMHFAKSQLMICEIKRHYKLCEGRLEYVMYMETSDTPLTQYLRAVYKKC